MCGICGIFGHSGRLDISPMISAMNHRGPDDSGMFLEDGISIGMTRLAVIDLSPNAHQPMRNNNGSVWIVYNGETYNFREERDVLLQKGYAFHSSSDTEVVLKMYEEYGDDFILRMNGMFALAVYDKRRGSGKERLLLARDHLGIKPLLYSRAGSKFVFASEMKSILANGFIKKQFDPEALRLLLTFGSVRQPMTAVTGVNMLLPGHRLIIESGSEKLERYWRLETDRASTLKNSSYEEMVSAVTESLEKAINMQMVSDVPIGAFLSGGVDSSLLVALMAKNTIGSRIKTFSVGFGQEGADIDETDDAQRVAKFIGTDHSRVVVTGKDVRDKINHIVKALDQPSVDGVNSYFVSYAARQAVTVAISGTGGDELFAGYPWFANMVKAYRPADPKKSLTAFKNLKSTLSRLYSLRNLLSVGRSGQADRNRLNDPKSNLDFLSLFAGQYQIFGAIGAANLLQKDFSRHSHIGRKPSQDIASSDELPNESIINRVSALCLRGYTQNQLLRDIDAVSMAHSLEVRVPFLNPALVDIALSLPDNTKMGDITSTANLSNATYRETGTKKILIDISKHVLPKGMDLQKKRGFGMPFDAWLKSSLKDVLDDTLSAQSIIKRGLFKTNEVQAVYNNFLDNHSHWSLPWLLMIIELWCREFID